ncbi:abortive phage resistance protein [Proteus mirabilis]|nr:abortive phage resistance protein [Proteus mirabilis]
MSNSPVLKLQDMAGSSSTDITELLSKAKMISVKLGISDITEWIDHELNGYPSRNLLPKYRVLRDLPIEAYNPYIGWIPYQLGDCRSHDALYESLTTIYFKNSVTELIELAKSAPPIRFRCSDEMSNFLQKISDCDFSMARCANPAQINNMFSQIKLIILDWALQLENKNILGEGLRFSAEEKKEAIEMTVHNTNNFHGNVNNTGAIGAGNTGNINQQNTINMGDFGSLKKQLKEYGISDNDILELKDIIDDTPKPVSSNNMGEKIGGWLGTIIGKAYSGSLKIAGSAAPLLLTNAICHYYGIPV